ncbi:MAG: DEAD/DEAH box helicase [Deltaproteobacteria bacterium]|nr:DEAD/DEAH box helicase [Deltaproteobacteria bacterium]
MIDETDIQALSPRAEKPEFLTNSKFEDFDLPDEILTGLKEAGYTYCTPIQAQVLPISLTGRDVAGQAQTGTGKTAAFLVTIFSRLLGSKSKKNGLPSALIVAPTRELALQIYEDARLIGRHTGLSLAQVVGGIDYRKQAERLIEGPDIVICTPGRIIDYLKQGIFKTGGIKILVVDEADRLFDLGFTKDMRYILRRLPHYEKRQSMLFSATLSHRVLALTYDYMNLPEFISVLPENITVDGIEQCLFHVGSDQKLSLLLGLLEQEDWTRVLIFSNTKADVEFLSGKLKGNGLPAEGITGDLPQPKRLRLMERFKTGKTKILVATDVASRGIHVEDISHVINYDLPQDPENYTHRIGRTARAGKTGKAFSFACENCVYYLEPIEKMLGEKIPVTWPDDDWFKEDQAAQVPSRVRGRKSRVLKGRRGSGKKSGRRQDSRKIAKGKESRGIFGLAPKPAVDTEKVHQKKKRGGRRKKADLSIDDRFDSATGQTSSPTP